MFLIIQRLQFGAWCLNFASYAHMNLSYIDRNVMLELQFLTEKIRLFLEVIFSVSHTETMQDICIKLFRMHKQSTPVMTGISISLIIVFHRKFFKKLS